MKTHPDLGVKYDPGGARKVPDEVFPDRSQMPTVTLLISDAEIHVRIAAAVQAKWKAALDVDVQIDKKKFSEFVASDSQVRRSIWCMDYPDAHNFLADDYFPKWNREAFDKVLDQASRERDTAKRRELYADAEELLVRTQAVSAPFKQS